MLTTTTHSIEGHTIDQYIGIVTGEVVLGTGFIKDWVASIKNWTGGHVKDYQNSFNDGARKAITAMHERALRAGANAIVGVHIDYTFIQPGGKGTILAVKAYGTAVKISQAQKKTTNFNAKNLKFANNQDL